MDANDHRPKLGVVLLALIAVAAVTFGITWKYEHSKMAREMAAMEAARPKAAEPAASAPAGEPPATTKSGKTVAARMHNVLFHFTDRSGALILDLNGALVPTGSNEMPVFDEKSSFAVLVASAQIAISPAALSDILNTLVLNKPDAPLKDLTMTIEDGKLKMKGKLHSKGDVPFQTQGTVAVNPDGRLRITTEKVKALKIPVKGMMNLFGIELASVINTSKIAGMDTDKNDLLIDLSTLLPPPHILGKVVAVRLDKNAIVTTMKGDAAPTEIGPDSGNFMAFRGNQLRFGKLTMTDSDLVVMDMTPNDPLDWNQNRYQQQLEAGYSKITPKFGLVAFAVDFAKLKNAKNADSRPTD